MSERTTGREQLEYQELRATIRQRGTARVWLFASGMVSWAGLTVATATVATTPLATLLPLLALASVFEAVFALHVGVERVGRYLQVFHESEADPGWEDAAMAFGRPKHSAATDPLFAILFLLAAIFNIAPALILEPTRQELVLVGGAHALFGLRLLLARDAARRQRAIDLARFQELKRTQARPTLENRS